MEWSRRLKSVESMNCFSLDFGVAEHQRVSEPGEGVLMKSAGLTAVCLAVLAFAGCASVSSPTTKGVRADDFAACDDYHRMCRDRCAPAGVKEVACYRDDLGGITRICECEDDTINPSDAPDGHSGGSGPTERAKTSYALGGGHSEPPLLKDPKEPAGVVRRD